MRYNFSIEKPELAYTASFYEDFGNYVGQLKIDEHRGFIETSKELVTYTGWRQNSSPTVFQANKHSRNFLFDGGILNTKDFKTKPLLYVFDILLIDGERTTLTYEDRLKLLNSLDVPDFLIKPICIYKNFDEEMSKIKTKKSSLVEEMSDKFGVNKRVMYEITEGLVIKNLDWKLSYPRNVHHNSNQIKLKINS